MSVRAKEDSPLWVAFGAGLLIIKSLASPRVTVASGYQLPPPPGLCVPPHLTIGRPTAHQLAQSPSDFKSLGHPQLDAGIPAPHLHSLWGPAGIVLDPCGCLPSQGTRQQSRRESSGPRPACLWVSHRQDSLTGESSGLQCGISEDSFEFQQNLFFRVLLFSFKGRRGECPMQGKNLEGVIPHPRCA